MTKESVEILIADKNRPYFIEAIEGLLRDRALEEFRSAVASGKITIQELEKLRNDLYQKTGNV